jgi:arylsulfate sulfotransferase
MWNALKRLVYGFLERPLPGLTALLVAGLFSPALNATISQVHLKPSLPSPQLLGTTITLTASASDTNPGPLTYKWEIQLPGSSAFSLMRDFDVKTTFSWVPNYTEGVYQLRLTARDYLAGTSAQQVISYQVNPLVTGNLPVAVPTANPLVALYSAPACPAGSTMRVVFQQTTSTVQNFTDWRTCIAGTMNFYIGGMGASQTYTMVNQVNTNGTIVNGPTVSFTTGVIPTTVKVPSMTVPVPISSQADSRSRIVLAGYTTAPYYPTAMDFNANVIWYYPVTASQLVHTVPGGTMLIIENGSGTGTGVWGPSITRQQILREVDLAGNTVRETNCDRVMEQLTAMGMTDPLGRFNHDAIRVSSPGTSLDGTTIALGDVQRIFPAGTQGSTGPVDIIGALIMIFDQNLQLLGYWNAFDYDCSGSTCVSITRAAPRGETCSVNAKGLTPDGCPPVLLLSPANDWLHANSVQYLPLDGDLLVSLRDQDWVIKIDYNNAIGTGNVLWRLGLSGDFALGNNVGQPYPWFSAQHDAGFVNVGNGEQTFTVFDNGVSRHALYGGDSRGQVWNIDQTAMVATLTTNADLGVYSYSLGAAQQLINGDYTFFAGNITQKGNPVKVQSTEVPATGTPFLFQLQGVGSTAYRGFRLTDFYNVQPNGNSGPE